MSPRAPGFSYVLLVVVCLYSLDSASSAALLRGDARVQLTRWGNYGGEETKLSAPRRFLNDEEDVYVADEHVNDEAEETQEPLSLQKESLPAPRCPVNYEATFTVTVKGPESVGVPDLLKSIIFPVALPGLTTDGRVSLVDSFSLPDLADKVLSGTCGLDMASAAAYRVFTFHVESKNAGLLRATTEYVLSSLVNDVMLRARLCGVIVTPLTIGDSEDCQDAPKEPVVEWVEGKSQQEDRVDMEATSAASMRQGNAIRGRRWGYSNNDRRYSNSHYSPSSGSSYGGTTHGQYSGGGHHNTYRSPPSSSNYHGSSYGQSNSGGYQSTHHSPPPSSNYGTATHYGNRQGNGGYQSTYRNPAPGNSYSHSPAYVPPSSSPSYSNYGGNSGNRYQTNHSYNNNVWGNYWGSYGRH